MKIFSREPRVESREPARRSQNFFCSRRSPLGPRPFRRHAFTLVEIMIAMAIFAMVVAAIYSTWMLILRAARVGQDTAAQAQRQRITLRTIEDSVTCIQSRCV